MEGIVRKEKEESQAFLDDFTLNNEFSFCGKTIEGLRAAAKYITGCTRYILVPSDEITLLSIKSREKYDLKATVLDPETAFSLLYGRNVKTKTVTIKPTQVLGEQTEEIGYFIAIRNPGKQNFPYDVYHTDQHFATTLAKIVGVGGEFVTRPGFARDLAIMNGLLAKNGEYRKTNGAYKILLGTREHHGARKVFFAGTSRYGRLMQDAVIGQFLEALDGFKEKAECRKWYIDHKITEVFMEFPEKKMAAGKDTIIPGVMLTTSDMGYSGITVKATYRIEGAAEPIIISESTKKHTKKTDILNLFTELDEEVFAPMAAFADNLDKMKKIKITNADEIYEEVLEKLSIPIIGSTRVEEMKNLLENAESQPKTYRDAAVRIMKLPGELKDVPMQAAEEIAKRIGGFLIAA